MVWHGVAQGIAWKSLRIGPVARGTRRALHDRMTVMRASLLAVACTLFACSSSGAQGPADAGMAGDAGGSGGDAGASTPDSAGGAGAVVACTGPDDCIVHIPLGPAVYCCLAGACIYGEAAIASTCSDPGGQTIEASNYDQSCTSDSDCAIVAEGDFCVPGANTCPMATINKSSLARYKADVAKTQAAVCGALASCPSGSGPCCHDGMCQIGIGCPTP